MCPDISYEIGHDFGLFWILSHLGKSLGFLPLPITFPDKIKKVGYKLWQIFFLSRSKITSVLVLQHFKMITALHMLPPVIYHLWGNIPNIVHKSFWLATQNTKAEYFIFWGSLHLAPATNTGGQSPITSLTTWIITIAYAGGSSLPCCPAHQPRQSPSDRQYERSGCDLHFIFLLHFTSGKAEQVVHVSHHAKKCIMRLYVYKC